MRNWVNHRAGPFLPNSTVFCSYSLLGSQLSPTFRNMIKNNNYFCWWQSQNNPSTLDFIGCFSSSDLKALNSHYRWRSPLYHFKKLKARECLRPFHWITWAVKFRMQGFIHVRLCQQTLSTPFSSTKLPAKWQQLGLCRLKILLVRI